MRDEIDGRLWEAHHQQFSDSLGRALDAAGAALGRLARPAVSLLSAIMLAGVVVTASAAAVETAALVAFAKGTIDV